MEFLIVTGLSGAGKSLVVDALEDIGFYCADNMPTSLISKFCELCDQAGLTRVALVTDIRSMDVFATLSGDLQQMRDENKQFKILFIDCDDNVLINRYKETRRKHPLADKYSSVTEAVRGERILMEPTAEIADYIINTTLITPTQLKERVSKMFLDTKGGMVVQVVSFGFKNGPFSEADLMFDVRCFPNPHYREDLRPQTGLDLPVREYVMNGTEVQGFMSRLYNMVDFMIPLYAAEGKSELVIGIGCTGGKHRSVAIAQALSRHLLSAEVRVVVTHRDMNK